MKSPISWVGSKRLVAKTIINLFPTNYETYVEPFFGSGAVYFAKQPDKIEVINDIHPKLIHFYRFIRDSNVDSLETFPVWTKEEFNNYHKTYIREDLYNLLSEIDKARLFLTLNAFSYGSTMTHWAETKNHDRGVKRVSISEIRERLRNTIIENMHVGDIVKKYDKPDTFYYLDPPYYISHFKAKHYEYSISPWDFNVIVQSIKGKWLVSFEKTKQVENTYSAYYITNIDIPYVLQNTKQTGEDRMIGKEVLISNYPIKKIDEWGE